MAMKRKLVCAAALPSTDIISGAIIGSLVGWGVPKLHEVDGVNLTIAPSGAGTAFGLMLRH